MDIRQAVGQELVGFAHGHGFRVSRVSLLRCLLTLLPFGLDFLVFGELSLTLVLGPLCLGNV